jgi:hypothetical protein
MKIRFILTMENLKVSGTFIDEAVLDWTAEMSEAGVSEISRQWVSSQTFLCDRIRGFQSVGESSLKIEPMPV